MAERRPIPRIITPANFRTGDVLIPHGRINQRLDELAEEIAPHYGNGENLKVIGVMTGAVWTTVALFDRLCNDQGVTEAKMDFMKISSYPTGTSAQGEPKIIYVPEINGEDDALLIEDLADSGKSVKVARDVINERKPKSLKTVVLLRKPEAMVENVEIDFVGFDIDLDWIEGVGTDTSGKYRAKRDVTLRQPEPVAIFEDSSFKSPQLIVDGLRR